MRAARGGGEARRLTGETVPPESPSAPEPGPLKVLLGGVGCVGPVAVALLALVLVAALFFSDPVFWIALVAFFCVVGGAAATKRRR